MMDVLEHTDDWYLRSFGELYPLIYRHRDDEQAHREAADIVALLGGGGAMRLLDIACGAGRHAEAFAGMGLDVCGVDLSQALLERASRRRPLRGRLVRADMRALPFDGAFDAAVNLFTSFGYFATDAENAAALHQMVRAVRSGGTFLIDLANRYRVEQDIEPHGEQQIDGWCVRHFRRLHGDRAIKRTVAEDPQGRRHTFTESVRLYRPDELLAMTQLVGLGDVRLLGDLSGAPLTAESPRMIAVGRRA